jgi:ketosteroid isomerase-like protein
MAFMKMTGAALFLLFASTFVSAAPNNSSAAPAEQVRKAEIDFARAFADRDPGKFFRYVAEDATFLSANRTLSGKEEIVKSWSGFFQEPAAPFSWAPERVVVNARGDLGLSTGAVRDPKGVVIGTYSSIWQRQKDGSWKAIFDGPGAPAPCPEVK